MTKNDIRSRFLIIFNHFLDGNQSQNASKYDIIFIFIVGRLLFLSIVSSRADKVVLLGLWRVSDRHSAPFKEGLGGASSSVVRCLLAYLRSFRPSKLQELYDQECRNE